VSNDAGLEGMASALAVGSTTVSASSNGVTGAAMWTVTDATLVSIEVSPAAPGVALGLTQQFTATGRYTDNTTQDLTTQVTWDSSDDAVATVSNAGGSEGEATTVAIGSTTVSASSGSVTGEATLTVTDATLVSIEVTPAAPILANGLTLEFTATGLYTDDSTQGLTSQVTWDSSNDAVATVSNADGSEGLATTAGVGSTTVSASIGSVTGETTLTVTDATLVSIEVTPADPSIASGLTQEFTATGHYTDDSTQVLTTQVTWSSSDTGVATVSNADGLKGLATAAIVGTATVYATSGVVIGETTLTVTDATLVSIEVTPATPSLANGLTQQFTAIGRYTDDSTQDLTTQVIWDSSNDAVATVSNAPGDEGLATTAGVGSADVSATSGVVTGQTTLTVTGATLVWIDVTPAAPSITSGLTQPFTAMGHYTDSSSQDLTALATWGSSEPAVATVSNAPGSHGVATGVGAGSTNVSASSSGVTGATTLTVTAPVLMSIDVTPADPSIANGATRQFTATGLYNNGSTQDLTTQVIWSSSNDAVATVSNTSGSNGLATAAGVGTATVYATSGSVTGDTTLTVIEAPPPPPTVEEMVAALLAAVTEIGGPGGSLVAKVRNVQNALPDFNAACNALVDFKDEVSAQNGKKLTPEQAEQLTADAVAIELAIPCSQF
jgi:hypothetical protein